MKKKKQENICLSNSGTLIQFIKAPSKDYISYLRFEGQHGDYLGALDANLERKELKKLQRWINHILKECSK